MEPLKTDRLFISPLSDGELSSLAESHRQSAPELSLAYGEMLEGCRAHPEQRLWYTAWRICARDGGAEVGCAGFRGLRPDGAAELGYGINEGFEGRGYASEAAAALCRWALSRPGVKRLEAEAEPDNSASLRVLEKLGFRPTGETGREGPRFVLTK